MIICLNSEKVEWRNSVMIYLGDYWSLPSSFRYRAQGRRRDQSNRGNHKPVFSQLHAVFKIYAGKRAEGTDKEHNESRLKGCGGQVRVFTPS